MPGLPPPRESHAMKTPILLTLAALALAGCDNPLMRPPPPPIGAQVTGDQLFAVLGGNSLQTAPEVVPPLVVFFGEKGDLHGLRGNNYRDSGTWTVDGDTVCGAWDNWYGTLSRCWAVYRSGERVTLKRADRDSTVTATLVPGDIAGLR